MTNYKALILSVEIIKKYCQQFKIKYEGRGKVFATICPFCGEFTAQNVAQTHLIKCIHTQCPRKGEKFTLLSIVKKNEPEKATWENEKIITYIKKLFKINNILTSQEEIEINKWFDIYESRGFSLTPLAKNDKGCIEDKWQNKEHKDKKEWMEWISTGLNIGLNCGMSKKTVIDIDQKPIPEEIKKIMGTTFVQETRRGFHLIYNQTLELPKTLIGEYIFVDNIGKEIFINNPNTPIKIENKLKTVRKMELETKGKIKFNGEEIEVILKKCLKIDIENSNTNQGAQVVVYPSIVEDIGRKFINEVQIIDIPQEFIDYLKTKIQQPTPKLTDSEMVKQEIKNETYTRPLLEEGEGRHDYLFRLGCILRKQLNLSDVEFALGVINKTSCSPNLPYTEMRNIVNSITDYNVFDEKELANQVLQHLKDVGESTRKDMERLVYGDTRLTKEDKQRLDKVINYLRKEEYIQQKRNMIFLVKRMEWENKLIDCSKPINFKLPYFYDLGYFAYGDLIIIGAKTGSGKTHIAMNIIKQLVEQGIKPYYINLETGSRFAKIALQLGLTEKDFSYNREYYNPLEVEFEKNAFTILDWLNPTSFADTHLIFEHLSKQLSKNKGILIVFVQLKEDGSFFAPNLINHFSALSTKYFYDDEDGVSGYFELCKIRESILKKRQIKIPCVYDWSTKRLTRVDEGKTESLTEENISTGKEEEK